MFKGILNVTKLKIYKIENFLYFFTLKLTHKYIITFTFEKHRYIYNKKKSILL